MTDTQKVNTTLEDQEMDLIDSLANGKIDQEAFEKKLEKINEARNNSEYGIVLEDVE